MTRDELFDVLRPIVLLVTGVPECILENPNAPAPTGEYASINPQVNVGQRGQANVNRTARPNNRQNVEIRRQVACTAWVNFYRGDTRTRAELLHECHKRPDVTASLFRARVGWRGADAVNDLTALQSANYESRSQIAINLWYVVSTSTEINSIEIVDVVVQNERADTILTIEIPVT